MAISDFLEEIIDDSEEFNPDFEIVNNLGYAIHEVYVAPSSEDEWGDDCLDDDQIIDDDEACEITFDTNSRKKYWDLRIVDEEEDEIIFEQIDLSTVSTVTLYYDDEGACADYE